MYKILSEKMLNDADLDDVYFQKKIFNWEIEGTSEPFYSIEVGTGDLGTLSLQKRVTTQIFLTDKEMERLTDFYNASKQEKDAEKQERIKLTLNLDASIYRFLEEKSQKYFKPISQIIETYLKGQLLAEDNLDRRDW